MNKFATLRFLLLLAVFVIFAGCGGSGSDDGDSSGTVRLALTDAVDHNYAAVVISIREVRAVPAGQEGDPDAGLPLIVSYPTPLEVDVLDLAFTQQLLGEAVLPAGRYHQLRLVLAANTDPLQPANYVVIAGDPEERIIPIDTPSGQQSGLKVVGGFEIGAGETVAVVVDFDPARAVVETGMEDKRMFQPTGIRVMQTEEVLETYGAITGQVARPSATGPVPATTATVYALPQGATMPIAAAAVSEVDGTFRLLLPPGEYVLKVMANGHPTYLSSGTFAVSNGQELDAGTVLLQAMQ